MRTMTSRARMLATLSHQEVDYPPCSFMLFNGLKSSCSSYLEFIERQLAMGLDVYVQIPPRPPVVVNDYYNLHGLPVSYAPEVEVQEWIEHSRGEKWPVMFKEYRTPAGTLRAEVYQDPGWRWGDHVPFLDDYIITRSRKFIISEPDDLNALSYLLAPPTTQEITQFEVESEPVLDYARQHELLVAGGWGVAADLVGWVNGLENMIFASYDRPQFLHAMLDVIARWNRQRMTVILDAGVDLYIKRAWYENCDFWSPKTWREFIFPILKEDVNLAHSRGTRFGYLITSNCMPLLEMIAETGVDVLMGVDPAMWDMALAKQKLAGKIALWGGVNGHITVETKSSEEVRAEVREAMRLLAPEGFILSPVDNVREYNEVSQRNVSALIDEWRRLSGQ